MQLIIKLRYFNHYNVFKVIWISIYGIYFDEDCLLNLKKIFWFHQIKLLLEAQMNHLHMTSYDSLLFLMVIGIIFIAYWHFPWT